MVPLAADHFIGDEALFLRLLETAVAAAGQDFLVTLGIKPSRPETGYGYIRAGGRCFEKARPALFIR